MLPDCSHPANISTIYVARNTVDVEIAVVKNLTNLKVEGTTYYGGSRELIM